MIKLARLTDYAVVVLADMAGDKGVLLAASTLADRTGLPEPTVAKVLKMLARAGIVESSRGAGGGYVLRRAASEIPVTQIVEAMEGPIALTACSSGAHDSCSLSGQCGMHGRWAPVNAAVRGGLAALSLADISAAGGRA